MSDHVKEIAVRLKTMREISGLTVEEMGERLTITAAEYARIRSAFFVKRLISSAFR